MEIAYREIDSVRHYNGDACCAQDNRQTHSGYEIGNIRVPSFYKTLNGATATR